MKNMFAMFFSLMLGSSLVTCGNTAPVQSVSQESSLSAIHSESLAVSSDGNSGTSNDSTLNTITTSGGDTPDTGKALIAYFSLFGNADYAEGGRRWEE